MIKPQKDFPLLKEYKKLFAVDGETVFPYRGDIYSDHTLPPDIYVHEITHLEQQKNIGADEWEKRYLNDPAFRLEQELQAYRVQLRMVKKLVKDKNQRNQARVKCAQALSGSLYGGIIDFKTAFEKLKV